MVTKIAGSVQIQHVFEQILINNSCFFLAKWMNGKCQGKNEGFPDQQWSKRIRSRDGCETWCIQFSTTTGCQYDTEFYTCARFSGTISNTIPDKTHLCSTMQPKGLFFIILGIELLYVRTCFQSFHSLKHHIATDILTLINAHTSSSVTEYRFHHPPSQNTDFSSVTEYRYHHPPSQNTDFSTTLHPVDPRPLLSRRKKNHSVPSISISSWRPCKV